MASPSKRPMAKTSQAAARGVLEELGGVPGFVGARIVDRGGVLLEHVGPGHVPLESFSALIATAYSSGDYLFTLLNAPGDLRLVAESNGRVVHVCGVGEEAILVTIADSKAYPAKVLPRVKEAQQKLSKLFKPAKK